MALKGDLESVPLGDVLQTLFQNEKEGTLKLNGPDYSKSIYCCAAGITLLEPEILTKRRFGDIVVAAGLSSRDELEKILKEFDDNRPIGQILISAGLIEQDTVNRILTIQVEEEIFSLFELSSGEFEFFENEKGSPTAEECGLPLFQVEGVVFEAARRMDEWAFIRKYVGDLDTVFIASGPPTEQDSPEVQKLLFSLNGRKTLRNIADALIASPFDVAKIAAELAKLGRIRPAEKHELLDLAQDLIDNDNIARAGTILKQLRPSLNNIVLGEEDVSSLADLFYKVGDILTATNLLLNKVREANESEAHGDSLTFLKQAHRIAPKDTRILSELAKISENLGDRDNRLQYMVSMAQVHINEEQHEAAIKVCREILEVDPHNLFVIEKMPDCLVNTHEKAEAIEFLEGIVEHLGKKGDPNLIVNIYRKILKIDPARKDIQEKLRKSQKRARTHSKKYLYMVGIAIILIGATFSWFVNTRPEEQSDMDRVAHAAMKLAQNDIQGARAMLLDIMNIIEDEEAKEQAQILLANIDQRASQGDRLKAEIEKKKYFDRLKESHQLVEEGCYDEAIIALKELSKEFDPVAFNKTTKEEAAKIIEGIKMEIPALKNQMNDFTTPAVEEEIVEVYEQYNPIITQEKAKTLSSLAQVLNDVSGEELFEDAVTESLIAEVEETAGKMEDLLDSLRDMEKRLERLTSLSDLSKLYDTAQQMETEGRLDEALVLYTQLVENYGEGTLKEEFTRKREDLQTFFDLLERIEQHTEKEEIEQAYELASGLVRDYEDPAHQDFVKIPVLLTTVPEAAHIRSQGRDLGTSPKVLYLQPDQSMNLSFEYEGYEHTFFVVDWKGGAVREYTLNRKTLFQVKLGGIVEGRPLLSGDSLYCASRSGDLFRLDPESGDILKKFNTRSLSGISCRVIEAHDHIYFNTVEGELWRLNSALELQNKIDLSAGTKCPPLATAHGIISACLDGVLNHHAPDLASSLWKYTGQGKLLATPLLLDGRIYATFTSGEMVCLDLETGKPLWETDTGSKSVVGMTAAQDFLVLCTGDGWVKGFGLSGGKEAWFIELNTYIHLPPMMDGEKVIILANKDVHILKSSDGSRMNGFSLGEEIVAASALDDGFICLGTKEGSLHYRRIDEDKALWVHRSPGAVTASPVLTQGTIFVVDKEGHLSAIER
jgi:outer membrane protein assembly factor BamB/tetratricopeptide (TPR) repeat protein